MRAVLLLLNLLLWLPACGPVNAAIALRDAREAIDMARQAGAPEVAVYEWTLATEYLEKAREENGYADYRMCVELSQRTVELASAAVDAVSGYRPVEEDAPVGTEQTEGPPAPEEEGVVPPPGDEAAPPAAPTEAPPGVTVYTDPATGTRYYIDPQTGQVVYLAPEASP